MTQTKHLKRLRRNKRKRRVSNIHRFSWGYSLKGTRWK